MSEVSTRANLLLEEAAQEAREEIVARLRDLGLSGHASSVLFALARMPQATAGDLVVRTAIPDSKIYYALRELVEVGLIEVQEGKPRTYRMVTGQDLEALLEQLLTSRFERQRAAITRVASLLEPLRLGAQSSTMDLAYVVKGRGNVLARAEGMIASAKREIVLLSSEEAFLQKLEGGLAQASDRGVHLKLAAPRPPGHPDLVKKADFRAIVCDCRLLVVDGQQILTINDTARGGVYAITSTDETLVRLGLDYWESPRCCVVGP